MFAAEEDCANPHHRILEDEHQILDVICAEYLNDNSNSSLSEVNALELIEWHYKKIKEEEKIHASE